MEILLKKTIFNWHKISFPDVSPDKQREKVIERWCDFYNAKTPEEKLEALASVYIANTGYYRFSPSEAAKVYANINAVLKRIPATESELLQAVKKKCVEFMQYT